ncbi:MAG: DUF4301 family protein [Bacteroidetes bacterium]|nr:DUF4301 family protein [Bacteroidota bacterium]
MFSDSDFTQISERGMTVEALEPQISHFIHGFPFIDLAKPATSGDGIVCPGEEDKKKFISWFDQSIEGLEVVKFVPASGAASRMFKQLFEFRETYEAGTSGEALFNKDNGFNSVRYFITHLEEIAFYGELSLKLEGNGLSLNELINKHDYNTIIDHVLTAQGLDYSNLPKGLIRFHDYPDGARTSAEEHMVEAALYASNSNRLARLHFTISPEHRSRFENLVSNVRDFYESKLKVSFDISYSVQEPSTDTIAVDEENKPFRNTDGSMLFRPGGHGALLQNLNDINADVVFVKNIDNIIPDRLKDPTVFNKKLIGGYLLWIRKHIFEFLGKAQGDNCTTEDIANVIEFCRKYLSLKLPEDFFGFTEKIQIQWLVHRLNRPIRVCGMVKNEGEPGGGPYWVKNKEGEISLQIVETSQVNMFDPEQLSVFRSATHFNPVDLVCSFRDYQGNKFDLSRYVDEETGLISLKSSSGKNLKALERPGLWNGAMAEWITVFMEVPVITFNPVKTVNDLLRKEHLRA